MTEHPNHPHRPSSNNASTNSSYNSFKGHRRMKRRSIGIICIILLVGVNLWMFSSTARPLSVKGIRQLTTVVGNALGTAHPPFTIPAGINSNVGLPTKMTELPGYLDRAHAATTSVNALFQVSVRIAAMRLEGDFRAVALSKFAKAPGGIAALERQPIITVRNKITEELSLFNEIRRFRPGYIEGITPEDDVAVRALYADSAGADKCDFCSVNRTALDTFGRIESKYCYTASNIAKYEKWHSLLVGRNHNPLDTNVEILHDYLLTAKKWFKTVNKEDPSVAFPFAAWDIGPRGSASQLHTHLQMAITPNRYFYRAEKLRKESAVFEQINAGVNYFTELVRAHMELGLAIQIGDKAVILSYLSPIKEKEIVILATDDSSVDLAKALHIAMTSLKEDFGVRALSVGFTFQPLTAPTADVHFAERPQSVEEQLRGYPAIIRLVDRGAMFDKRADVGAMEFFGANNVGADPFAIISSLRKHAATV